MLQGKSLTSSPDGILTLAPAPVAEDGAAAPAADTPVDGKPKTATQTITLANLTLFTWKSNFYFTVTTSLLPFNLLVKWSQMEIMFKMRLGVICH